jgi:hypothetical protein
VVTVDPIAPIPDLSRFLSVPLSLSDCRMVDVRYVVAIDAEPLEESK